MLTLPQPRSNRLVGWGQGNLRAFTSASSPKIPAPRLTLDNQEELGQRQGVHVSVPQARYPSIPSEGQQETPPVVVGAEPQEVTPSPQHRPPLPPPPTCPTDSPLPDLKDLKSQVAS